LKKINKNFYRKANFLDFLLQNPGKISKYLYNLPLERPRPSAAVSPQPSQRDIFFTTAAALFTSYMILCAQPC
jgi:hypothetical protein